MNRIAFWWWRVRLALEFRRRSSLGLIGSFQYVRDSGKESWRHYYDDGYYPYAAAYEDMTDWEP